MPVLLVFPDSGPVWFGFGAQKHVCRARELEKGWLQPRAPRQHLRFRSIRSSASCDSCLLVPGTAGDSGAVVVVRSEVRGDGGQQAVSSRETGRGTEQEGQRTSKALGLDSCGQYLALPSGTD